MADETPTAPETPTETSAAEPDAVQAVGRPDPEDALGDAGKRALQALRQEIKELRAKLKHYEQASDDASAARRDASGEAESTSGSATPTDVDSSPSATEGTDVKPEPPRFQGTGDGGARKAAVYARQLTADDLKSMTPRQIDQARREGRLRDLLSGEHR